ncbi:hypothetical protein PC116_g29192 [Phytophthora cactorum]|nr:hypothetical protein PC116_g29192 [Phytophthora cactorum]
MQVLMDGTVPAGGGLSSSAAFVSASALAVMIANGERDVDKKALTEVAIVSERAVGVNSGGMAAAYLNAKLCPKGTELPKDAGPLGVSIRGFHQNYFKDSAKSMPEQLTELIELTKSTLTQEQGYTLEEVASGIGISVDEVKARFMSSFPVRGEYFKLRQRALHVFTEALRVLKFLALLEDPAQAPDSEHTVEYNKKLGKLLNETQDSCRDVYECSCPEIDELCKIAREAGSYGSRLTGAGWGGCSVHLVPADKIDDIKKALVDKYYSKRNLSEKDLEEAIVVSRPMNGSAVFKLKGGKI